MQANQETFRYSERDAIFLRSPHLVSLAVGVILPVEAALSFAVILCSVSQPPRCGVVNERVELFEERLRDYCKVYL